MTSQISLELYTVHHSLTIFASMWDSKNLIEMFSFCPHTEHNRNIGAAQAAIAAPFGV
ncbi:hypothetical protein [Pseudosulfitobacter sp. DSM 107133]|uniref:hypothetical protein n=1 Tax=Pseudosulfitobacter sp. DSM 107133 TaxID=2883100 RepID=UPI0013B35985|nr:hypothetical protein [Pseudosulfitobacter sp. DSM 107133]